MRAFRCLTVEFTRVAEPAVAGRLSEGLGVTVMEARLHEFIHQ
jgi:hypothetical protein